MNGVRPGRKPQSLRAWTAPAYGARGRGVRRPRRSALVVGAQAGPRPDPSAGGTAAPAVPAGAARDRPSGAGSRRAQALGAEARQFRSGRKQADGVAAGNRFHGEALGTAEVSVSASDHEESGAEPHSHSSAEAPPVAASDSTAAPNSAAASAASAAAAAPTSAADAGSSSAAATVIRSDRDAARPRLRRQEPRPHRAARTSLTSIRRPDDSTPEAQGSAADRCDWAVGDLCAGTRTDRIELPPGLLEQFGSREIHALRIAVGP